MQDVAQWRVYCAGCSRVTTTYDFAERVVALTSYVTALSILQLQ